MGLGDEGFRDGSQGYGGTLSMVLCLQMGSKTSLTILGVLIEIPAFVCIDGQPYLVRWRSLFLSLSEEGRNKPRRGEVEVKYQQAPLQDPEKGLNRLSLAHGVPYLLWAERCST